LNSFFHSLEPNRQFDNRALFSSILEDSAFIPQNINRSNVPPPLIRQTDPFSHSNSPFHQYSFSNYVPEDFNQFKKGVTTTVTASSNPSAAILSKIAKVSAIPPNSFNLSSMKRKHRFLWSKSLHSIFIDAYTSLEANQIIPTPKKVMNVMRDMKAPMEGLTRVKVASHLQKYQKRKGKLQTGHKEKKIPDLPTLPLKNEEKI